MLLIQIRKYVLINSAEWDGGAWKWFALVWFSTEQGFYYYIVCICQVSSSSVFWINLLLSTKILNKDGRSLTIVSEPVDRRCSYIFFLRIRTRFCHLPTSVFWWPWERYPWWETARKPGKVLSRIPTGKTSGAGPWDTRNLNLVKHNYV